MSQKLHFELVSPEKLLMDAPVDMVEIPGSDGDLGVLPGHAPMMSTIRPGLVCVFSNADKDADRFFLKGGFVEVTPAGVVILAEETLDPESVDRAKLAEDITEAQKAVDTADTEHDRKHAAAELAWMQALADID